MYTLEALAMIPLISGVYARARTHTQGTSPAYSLSITLHNNHANIFQVSRSQ